MTTDKRPAVLTALVNTYTALGAAWETTLGDTDCAPDAPRAHWRAVEPDGPVTAWHVLLQTGELAGATAGNTVRAHLALLGRAYWPDLLDPADDPIQFPAAYPPARAVLEATAVAGWVLDPAITPQDRAQRTAELLLWSQVSTGRHDARWQDTVAEAGFEVRTPRTRPDAHYVWTGERSRPLTLARMIVTVHGNTGAELYRMWSPASHPDPIALAERATVRVREGGYGVGGLIREDRDVEVAVHVADLIAAAIACQAGYFGRSAAPAQDCRAIAAELREFLPTLAAAVSARNARAQ